jgi:hypothetical protein
VIAQALEEGDPVDLRDFYEERAGILEFDGGLPRSDAEYQALAETAVEFGLTVEEVRRLTAQAGTLGDE